MVGGAGTEMQLPPGQGGLGGTSCCAVWKRSTDFRHGNLGRTNWSSCVLNGKKKETFKADRRT